MKGGQHMNQQRHHIRTIANSIYRDDATTTETSCLMCLMSFCYNSSPFYIFFPISHKSHPSACFPQHLSVCMCQCLLCQGVECVCCLCACLRFTCVCLSACFTENKKGLPHGSESVFTGVAKKSSQQLITVELISLHIAS